jgi:uncharacterized protein
MDWLSIFYLVLLGFVIGALGTLIGAGGGFVLVPVLLILYPYDNPEVITSISLFVVFLNAASGSFAYSKMKRIDYKSALLFAAATLPGAIIGAFTTSIIPRKIFDIILGIILVIISVTLVFKPSFARANTMEHPGHTTRELVDQSGSRYRYSFNLTTGIVLSFFVGFLSSLLGIGGGIIHVPALTTLLNFPVHIATATSHFILAIMALAGTAVHIYQGNLQHQWHLALPIGLGVLAGAQLGAYFSDKIHSKWIIRFLALALFIVGIRLLISWLL